MHTLSSGASPTQRYSLVDVEVICLDEELSFILYFEHYFFTSHEPNIDAVFAS